MKTPGVHKKQNRRLYEAEKVWRRRVSGQGPLDQTNTPPPVPMTFLRLDFSLALYLQMTYYCSLNEVCHIIKY